MPKLWLRFDFREGADERIFDQSVAMDFTAELSAAGREPLQHRNVDVDDVIALPGTKNFDAPVRQRSVVEFSEVTVQFCDAETIAAHVDRGVGYDTLTSRERTVLQMVEEGLSSKEVAGRLAVSAKIVEYHREQLMQKLGIHEVAGLTRFAVRHGLVSIE